MNASNFVYSIKQGFKNIYHNRLFSLASMGTIAACLFLFGVFYFMLANFQYMIKEAETSVGVTVFFEEGTSEARMHEIGKMIAKRPEVADVEFTSAEEAWEKVKEQLFEGREELAESFGDDNPLADSASYGVYLRDVSKQSQLVAYIEGIQDVREVKSSDTTAEGLTTFNKLVGYISLAIVVILIGVAIFLISTTISMGISVRKDEIAIMKLIGATDFFIRAPFIVEGIIIGVIGAVIPLVILWFLYRKIVGYISAKFLLLSGVLNFLDAKTVFATLIPVAFGMGIGIGLIGSFITVRKHLRV
ncbi:MAG: permease-like cell division protein FtsX [Lachnospiraceae bacterium]|nr:permease-like cell division protein FtsX [Lachnospiraceae bacterium]MBQ9562009.1 permease-like cell division protein FtsX [Lachnospiraceae bacterium]MBQ9592769.1 permease-like cell division protein FtsX [Lachnospiraceae bacterium]